MQTKNLPNITSLRFFLALLVVIFHISQFSANRGFPSFDGLPVFRKGTEAVYMFFSLSGFLIIRNLFEEKLKTGTVSLKAFYKRRILRIFPLYYAVLIFGLLYYNIILPKLGFEVDERQYSVWQGIVLGGTFFSNILAAYRPGGILEILWSIGIEEQFYLFVAPLFLLIPVKKLFYFLLFFTVVYFLVYNAKSVEILRDYKMLFYYFSFSGLVAILYVKYADFKIYFPFKILILGTFVIYFITDFFTDNLSDSAYQLISMLLFSASIFCLIQTPYRILENKNLKYLGKISYGIYMTHAIVMQITGLVFLKIVAQHKFINSAIFILSFNLATIILTIIVAHLSYKYFESYFLKYKSTK